MSKHDRVPINLYLQKQVAGCLEETQVLEFGRQFCT
jgi:hypothetical protein